MKTGPTSNARSRPLRDWRVRGLQPFEYGRGRHDACGAVPFQGKQTLVSRDEKRGLADCGERQQEAVLGIARYAGRRRLGIAEGQVVKGRGKKLCIALAQPCPEERPLQNFAEFRKELIRDDQREPFLLPGGEPLD